MTYTVIFTPLDAELHLNDIHASFILPVEGLNQLPLGRRSASPDEWFVCTHNLRISFLFKVSVFDLHT